MRAALLLGAVLSPLGVVLTPAVARADGALAIGITDGDPRKGISYGYAVSFGSNEAAMDAALNECRTNKEGEKKVQKFCRVSHTFKDKCVAIAYDPKPGTPGFGWAIEADRQTASDMAVTNCKVLAGATRLEFCKAVAAGCDGDKKSDKPDAPK